MEECIDEILDLINNETNITRSKIMEEYKDKYPKDIIIDALDFLENNELIGSRKVDTLEHYSRITGYYQKVSGWNDGKTQEFNDRRRVRI